MGFIFNEIYIYSLSPEQLDQRLATGWRHFNTLFFRYNLSIHDGKVCEVIPLRIRLNGFTFTKSQRKILKKALAFRTEVSYVRFSPIHHAIFNAHKAKFGSGAPDSLHTLVDEHPSVLCHTRMLEVFDGSKLVAFSFIDIGKEAISSIYACYDPAYAAYSLGNYTMYQEIRYSIAQQKDFYYHGYCYSIPSFYDYKKRFNNLEYFDWNGHWKPIAKNSF